MATGGHFFGAAHTMERYESAFYRPLLSDWTNYGAWEAAGSKDALTAPRKSGSRRCANTSRRRSIPPCVEALDAYVARRREEIGQGEP